MLVEEPEQIGSVQFNLKIKNDSTNQACQYVFVWTPMVESQITSTFTKEFRCNFKVLTCT